MKRTWWAAALFLAGCNSNETALLVHGVLAPDDPAWLEYLRVALDGCVGKIGSMLHWLPRNANQFAESIVGVVSTELAALGPSAGDL